ncbi:MAG TPA: cyclodeaminase/cyclohydrolase family protein [Gemmatimonadales bacterium]|nr:cyclodeaminase/cyclohydrolase family protein [Gemmatimonadales bacterium]
MMTGGSPDGPAATIGAWLESIAAPTPAPGGGASAALTAALAAAAVEMVAGLTLDRERYAPVHERARAAQRRVHVLREAMVDLARRDADAFAAFGRALAMPRSTDLEIAARVAARRAALAEGADVQLALLAHLAELGDHAAMLAEHGLASALGDAATGGFLAAGAARSAYWAVRANLQDSAADPAVRHRLEAGLGFLERAEAAEWRIRQLANERIR